MTKDYLAHAIVFAADERDPLVSDSIGLSVYRFVGVRNQEIFYIKQTRSGFMRRVTVWISLLIGIFI